MDERLAVIPRVLSVASLSGPFKIAAASYLPQIN